MKHLLTFLLLVLTAFGHAQTTWYEIPTNTDKHLNTICFASDSVGYIGGNDSLLLKTTDGGFTWSEVNYSGVTFASGGEHLLNLKFVNELVGYMTVGPYTGTFKTVDGGLTWSAITFVGIMCYNEGLYFWDEDNGMVGGAGCFQGEYIERISSGTWVSSTVNSPSSWALDYVKDIDFLGNDFGMAVSQNRYLRSTDGGVTWDTISGPPNKPLTSIEIINDTLIYAGYKDTTSGGMGLLMSTDSGFTWTEEFSMATFFYPDYNDVGEAPNGYRYAAGGTGFMNQGLVFEDKGSGWWYYQVDHQLQAIDSYGDSTVFMVGDSGLVITNIDPSFSNIQDESEKTMSVNIFPNPVNDQLTYSINGFIEFQTHNIKIYDISGREIFAETTNINTLSTTNLKSGIYVLEISNEDITVNRKFLKN